jgi:hypothetical protein
MTEKPLKILLFITGYRHLKEYRYFNLFLKNLKIKDHCDLFFYCNNPDISPEIVQYFQEFENPIKNLHITHLNSGFRVGGVEALSQGFEMGIFKGYDYVIHLHPDVFLTDDQYLLQVLQENIDNDTVFFITKCFMHEESMFAFDFFIFKPHLLTSNIFIKDLYNFEDYPEQYLRNMILQHNIKYTFIKRFENNYWSPRRIDENLKLYHEHDLEKVEQVLRERNLLHRP